MSTFVVQYSEIGNPFTNSHGNTLYPIKLSGILDGQIVTNAYMNVKDVKNAFQVGSTNECVIEKKDDHGIKLAKPKQPPPGSDPIPAQNPPQGTVVPQPSQSSYPPREDPDVKRGSIERQNSLTSAIAYCTAQAQILLAAKKVEEAEKELTGKHVLDVASYFSRYNAGKIIASMSPEEVALELGYELPDNHPYEEDNE